MIGTVSGTPQFLVNGVEVGASSSWTLDDWKKVINPLLGKATFAKVPYYEFYSLSRGIYETSKVHGPIFQNLIFCFI